MGFQESCVGSGVSLNVGDADFTNITNTDSVLNNRVQVFNHATVETSDITVTSDPIEIPNVIVIIGANIMGGRGGSQTWTMRIFEDGVKLGADLTSTFNTISVDEGLTMIRTSLSVPVGSVDYEVRSLSSSANNIALRCTSLGTQVIRG